MLEIIVAAVRADGQVDGQMVFPEQSKTFTLGDKLDIAQEHQPWRDSRIVTDNRDGSMGGTYRLNHREDSSLNGEYVRGNYLHGAGGLSESNVNGDPCRDAKVPWPATGQLHALLAFSGLSGIPGISGRERGGGTETEPPIGWARDRLSRRPTRPTAGSRTGTRAVSPSQQYGSDGRCIERQSSTSLPQTAVPVSNYSFIRGTPFAAWASAGAGARIP